MEVIVMDPSFAPTYATRSKKQKTDKRDARCLAQACKLGAYRLAHRLSDEQRRVRMQLGRLKGRRLLLSCERAQACPRGGWLTLVP